MSLQYINSATLVSIIDNATDNNDFAVIDVRDEDEYASGHIVGSKHMCSEKWYDTEFVEQVLLTHRNTKKIIVHCLMSQQRGPKCARILLNKIESLNTIERGKRPEM